MRLKNEKISFSTVYLVFDSGTGNFFPDAVFGDGNSDQKNCGSKLFPSVDWDVRRNFTVRGSGRIRNEGCIPLCGRLFPQFLFYVPAVLVLFALLLELSTESVEQTKNVLCMRFVF